MYLNSRLIKLISLESEILTPIFRLMHSNPSFMDLKLEVAI